jgi:hypothetical protein
LGEKVENLQTEAAEAKIINMPGTAASVNDTALAAITSEYTALTTNVMEIINENLKNQPLSQQLFDVIKAPSGGATVFTVPGIAGEELQKELVGIILDYGTPRAYWDTPDPVEGTPPNCYSRDSLVSFKGEPCAKCAFNEFGSTQKNDSNAKACKEMIELYLLRPDNIMPLIVRVPVSSKRIFQKYMARLVSNLIPVCGVVTKITLEKATSRAGQPYAKYIFEAVKEISQEETAQAKAFGQKFAEILSEAADLEDRAAETKAAG